MTHPRPVSPAQRGPGATARLAELAAGQAGVVGRAQLLAAGVSDSGISRWSASGRIHRIHPGVYAVGHAALSLKGRLHAALLYAGPDAAFSYTTAGWLWRIVDAEPTRIHLTVPGRRRSLPEIKVHRACRMTALDCRGYPVTPVGRTLVDLAAMLSYRALRRALAEADFRELLAPGEVRAVLRSGQPGSRALRRALKSHLPELAKTINDLEQRFVELCESAGLPLPEMNARVGRMRVDALWREQGLAVELDGGPAHGGVAAMKRDRQRELVLRAMGLRVVRYTWDQITTCPDEVIADLRRLLRLP